MEAPGGVCGAEAEVVPGTELLIVLTKEENGSLRDTVEMIKCKFLDKSYFHFKTLVVHSMNLLRVNI